MIKVVQGDIASVTASAILRPVSAEWDSVSSAGRRLDVAAGPQLDEQCQKLGELPVGSAVLTSAGRLKADYVVHAIVRSVDEPVSESSVYRAVQNSLRRCVEWGIDSLAMPPVGTGAGNLDIEEAASVIVPVLLEHMRDADYPAEVSIIVESEYEHEAFQLEVSRYDLPILPAYPETPTGNQDG